ESPEVVAARITRAFPHCPPERIIVAPDCGMKYLPREVAFGKMVSMAKGTAIVREALETARAATRKSKDKGRAPEIRTKAKPAAKAKAKAKPAAKAAKAKPKAKAKTKPAAKKKAGKKR
ncbi:MAG: hypothetical protein KIT16_23805, partial [Rhodospirillaceae bacterium]|nr:hypothetical protein [Rhodospirillaceae bacterium]